MKIRFRSYGTNAGGPANAGGAPSSSRKMQATKAQVDEVRIKDSISYAAFVYESKTMAQRLRPMVKPFKPKKKTVF